MFYLIRVEAWGAGWDFFPQEVAQLVVVKSVANFLLKEMFLAVSLGQLRVSCYVLSEVTLSVTQPLQPLPKLLPTSYSNTHLIRIFDVTPSQPTLICPCLIYFICGYIIPISHTKMQLWCREKGTKFSSEAEALGSVCF